MHVNVCIHARSAYFLLDSKGKVGEWSDKVTTPSAKCHVKEENVYSQCRKPANDGLSGKYHHSPTPTGPFFCLSAFPCPSADSRPLGNSDSMCMLARAFNPTFKLNRLLFEYQGIEIQFLLAWDGKTYCK